jgi:hypothetical protein
LPAAVEVICPGCKGSFLVPVGIAETLCPYCDEHIVWRRCLDTDEVFPVLTKWPTWVHPGCSSEHLVDLTVHISRPADGEDGEQPATDEAPTEAAPDAGARHEAPPETTDLLPEQQPVTDQQFAPAAVPPLLLLDQAEWVEQQVAGQLIVLQEHIVMMAAGSPQPITLAPVADIVSCGVTSTDGAAGEQPAKKKRFRRGARVSDDATPLVRLTLATPYAQWTIVGRADAEVLRSQLHSVMPNASHVDFPQDDGPPAFLSWAPTGDQPPPGQPPQGQ